MDQQGCSECGGPLPPDVRVGMPPGFVGVCGFECFMSVAENKPEII